MSFANIEASLLITSAYKLFDDLVKVRFFVKIVMTLD